MNPYIRLETLTEGTRFRYPECGKIGVVLSHGQMGTRVRFENDDKVVTIEADEFKGRPERTFTIKGGPEIVSSGSEVMLWPESSPAGGSGTQRRAKSSARSKRGKGKRARTKR